MKRPLFCAAAIVAGVAFFFLPGCQNAPAGHGFGAVATSAQPSNAPTDLAPAYTAAGLRQAFADLCQMLRYRPIRVQVDQSEFPFVVYGVLEGRCDYKDIRDALNTMLGYAYTGCVTMSSSDGARTIFALNMTPNHVGVRPDMREFMGRLKALADSQR